MQDTSPRPPGGTQRRTGGRQREGPGAHERALRLLAVRARSRRELERRLLRAGHDPQEVTDALDRLEGAGLVDDEAFARAVVDEQVGRRLLGRRAAMGALLSTGVGRDVAERVLEGVAGTDDERADALAHRRAARMSNLEPAIAHRRLVSFLQRRGYGPETARSAATRAMGTELPDA